MQAERVHAGFTLVERGSRKRLTSKEAARLGVVLSADSRLLKHKVKKNSHSPVLIVEDVTHLYGLCMKVATG